MTYIEIYLREVAEMKLIIDISAKLKQKVDQQIKERDYGNFNTFINVAIENQLALESEFQVATVKESNKVSPKKLFVPHSQRSELSVKELFKTLKVEEDNYRYLSIPQDQLIVEGPLWGQFYKFLPCKVALRVLLKMSKDSFPTVEEFRENAYDIAEQVGNYLREWDNMPNKSHKANVSVSFPTSESSSRERFINQFLVYVRPMDGLLDGMLARMKFINVERDDYSIRVGITKGGFDFAKLDNPIMDKDVDSPSLTEVEADFLWNFIKNNVRGEFEEMVEIMRSIERGIISRPELNNAMAEYYKKHITWKASWTDAMVSTMRAGVVSRLFEMGLLQKKKAGLTVSYNLSEKGKNMLEKMESD